MVETTPLKGVITCHTLCSKKHYCVVYDATFYCFFYLANVVFPLFMPYFEIKRCLCGVKYDTNIKNSILISRARWQG